MKSNSKVAVDYSIVYPNDEYLHHSSKTMALIGLDLDDALAREALFSPHAFVRIVFQFDGRAGC